ncbi:hypothetical protein AURDEDRAFT_111290 [Auricularia subglabra TFB-10046 SS5]|nr:hypothetical protein AURDEDRAFT_111290 [Auricularia subglabra TFB-10046 SS5]
MSAQKAIVKSVLSGDTLVLRGRPGPQGQLPKERVLHIAEVSAPRMGTQSRPDEPWAFECREYLRALAVGKEITFTTTHSLPSQDGTPRDFGVAEIGGHDLATELLRNGFAKAKELKRDPTEEDLKRRELENEAKVNSRGMWNPQGPKTYDVRHLMPADGQAFLNEWKGQQIDAVVEQVRDGTTLRLRLLLPDNVHQMVNVGLAGVRSARAASKQGETAEQWGEEAKFFAESRMLQRAVRVTLLSQTGLGATPVGTGAPAGPSPAGLYIGIVMHPAGNIAEHLVANGLARVVDWHAGMLASHGGTERLRAAERAAKEKRLCLYANAPASGNGASGNGHAYADGSPKNFEATVIRIWSADQISVVNKSTGKEHRLQLASTRGPKPSDPKQAFYAAEAKELLRKKLIGKHVRVHIDYVKPKEGDYEERECATIRYGGANANIAEQLIEKGLATALRHRRDDEDRSTEYDKLMAAEQAAVAESRGLHSGKEQVLPRVGNASETSSKATQFLSGFKRLGRVPAVVDFVAAGSRFKLLIPKENQTLTFVLAGIRAPRTARNSSEKSEPFGPEAYEFATRRYLQRDVEVEFEAVDKTGGFIGAMYFNKNENVALTLVREGLASVHGYSAEGLSWSKQLFDAENEAKREHKNLWKDYDAAAEAAPQEAAATETGPLKDEFLDLIITDIRPTPSFTFSVQILTSDGIASLEKLMHDFSLHHKTAVSPAGFAPRNGELISARFSDGAWYRAKVKRSSPIKKEAEVQFIDYGNHDTVAFKDCRPLDPKFKSLPGQAVDARLSFIKLVDPESEYHQESVDRFRALCEGRKLIGNIDHKEGTLLHLRLIDPSDPLSAEDPLASINADLVREGLASIDRKGCRYLNSYPAVLKKLQEAVKDAKLRRHGMFEYGDVEDDE